MFGVFLLHLVCPLRGFVGMVIEDAYGESPPPPGIHHFAARPADIKQDFAGFCRNLLNFGTFQQDLTIIDQNLA